MNNLTYAAAQCFASDRHANQTDKSGHPYIDHPLRVAARVADETARVVAVLHDILEDTPTTVEELRALGASDAVIEALLLLTHRKDVPYEDYIRAIARHSLARAVKLADIADNTDPARLALLPAEVRARLEAKYRLALAILTEEAPAAHGKVAE